MKTEPYKDWGDMSEEERREWKAAGDIADQIHDMKKQGIVIPTLRQTLLERESRERIDRW